MIWFFVLMKLLGFFLLVSGGGLALASLALLRNPSAVAVFLCFSVGVELLGLGLVAKAHIPIQRRP